MKTITTLDMKVLDLNTKALGVSTSKLMENAGAEVARAIISRVSCGTAVVFAGKGGNGGDGLVAARHLAYHGFKVLVILTCKPEEIEHPDAKENFKVIKLMDRSIKLKVAPTQDLIEPVDADVIIDGLLGTGVRGKLCLLYTSDAADELDGVELGGRRIMKKKK